MALKFIRTLERSLLRYLISCILQINYLKISKSPTSEKIIYLYSFFEVPQTIFINFIVRIFIKLFSNF